MRGSAAYSAEQMTLFAAYAEHRALCRPAQCHYSGTDPCWVREGPPALAGGRCAGCRGRPTSPLGGDP